MKKMRKIIMRGVTVALLSFVFIIGAMVAIKGNEMMSGVEIRVLSCDKARYAPGDEVWVELEAENTNSSAIKDATLVAEVYQLDEKLSTDTIPIAMEGNKKCELEWKWDAAPEDYQGYLLKFDLLDQRGNVLSTDTVGVDVSSDWTKFPRYGYLCNYDEDVDTAEKIDEMNRYHINGIEYYDWHALHHEPVPDSVTRENLGVWEDWSGRQIYGDTIRNYIDAAHEKNMVNMAYNMIYAATDSLVKGDNEEAKKAQQWQLYFAEDNDRGQGEFSFNMGFSPSGDGHLYFMNPLNEEWQNYIFAQENHIFDVLDFDGWHGDTVGDWGKMQTADGSPLGYDENGEAIYEVKDTYQEFLDAAKDALGGHYLSFNPVGAQGIEEANRSKTDVLYTEFWPWDSDRTGVSYNTYQSLVTEVERSMEDSKEQSKDGKGKSLTVKAYINYNKTCGEMNAPGVLLLDAAVYAAGGNRLELGNGNHMLHMEYYPKDDVLMGADLEGQMEDLSDFIVAYENLLRDGQKTSENLVKADGFSLSRSGESNFIWAYTRADQEHEILHLINLLGTDNEWRDEMGKKKAPEAVTNIPIKYYTKKAISKVSLASFSMNHGISQELHFTSGEDQDGKYIQFMVPSLEYWDMIYMTE